MIATDHPQEYVVNAKDYHSFYQWVHNNEQQKVDIS